jgi:spore germination protein GerM
VPPDVQLLDITIADGTATVNFDQLPTYTDSSGLDAIALTLTEFPTIQRVQFQVHGQNIGGPAARLELNPLNPLGLPADTGATLFLPLYFPSIDGAHDIRLTRFAPPTNQVAEATVRALLEGPGDYGSALRRVVPANTELRDIRLENGVLTVDFSRSFADSQDRAAAVRTLVESLTTWKTVRSVQFLVEGRSLAEQWGANYGAVFERPPINPE